MIRLFDAVYQRATSNGGAPSVSRYRRMGVHTLGRHPQLEPDLVMLDLEPTAHPLLYLRYRRASENQGRVRRVREWLVNVFDSTDKPWFRDEFVHPRDFGRIRTPTNLAARAS